MDNNNKIEKCFPNGNELKQSADKVIIEIKYQLKQLQILDLELKELHAKLIKDKNTYAAGYLEITIDALRENIGQYDGIDELKNKPALNVVLGAYDWQYEEIIKIPDYKTKNDLLKILMTELEKEFSIPIFNDELWNRRHKDVIDLYRKISNARELLNRNFKCCHYHN